MPEVFDVVVAGGGPAGAVTAMCLARLGWKVVLLEAAPGPVDRYGETLPPEINPLLRDLGLWGALERSSPLESPGIVTSWGSSQLGEQDFIANPYGCGWHVDRFRFDQQLRNEAERAGVTIRRGVRVTGCVRQHDGWHLDGARARALVDATGRNGLRTDGAASRHIDDILLVLVLRICHPNRRSPDLRTYIEAVQGGWWYWAPLPDGGSIAMFFTGREEYVQLRRLFPEVLLESATATRDLVRSGYIATARWISVSSSIRKSMQGGDLLAAGDSASSYDPLSGRGIFKAIRDGSLAAQALDRSLRGEPEALVQYQERVCREYREYSVQRKAYYAMERRWPTSSFWSRRSQGKSRLPDPS